MPVTILASIALTLFVQQAAVPPPPPPQVPVPAIAGTTPAECVKTARDFTMAKQRNARSMTAELVRSIDAEKIAGAKTCAAQFDAAKMADKNLAGLIELYNEAAMPELAKSTLARAMASTTLGEVDRASVLVIAVNTWLREPKGDARNARLESLVDELDKLSAAAIEQKISAHSQMNGFYRADDIDAGIIKHSTWLINTGETFSPEFRKKHGMSVVSAHVNMAEAWAGHGRTDDALKLLRRALDDWKDLPHTAGYVGPALKRYELVGTDAAPIAAPTWLNAPAGTSAIDMKGHVTLLEFTAHWCGPCKESYPGIIRLREKYGARGFRVVLATELYGYFEAERNLTPDQEIERDKMYFAKHGMEVPLAVQNRPALETVNGRPVYKREPNSENYRVGGIPQVHIIDRQGKIRLIMVGYDDANEARLGALIEQLLTPTGGR